jgi:2-oxo-4-hydroxy-4-carboxy-5-ureidoimidazoline decarboxylase
MRSMSVATACTWPPNWPAAVRTSTTMRCSGRPTRCCSGCPRIDSILQAYPDVGRRPGSEKSQAEQCAVTDERPEVMDQLGAAAKKYFAHFGFGFVMYVNGYCAQDVLATMTDRLQNDYETERKVVRNELARINRTRLDRMLGPEGGYDNW